MIGKTKEELLEKRRLALQRIGITIYIVNIAIEIAMFFIMRSAGLMYDDPADYILDYMVKPMAINTIILMVCICAVYVCKNVRMKSFIEILMITLMLSCEAYIHHVFSVLLITFCVPILLTVFLQDKRSLDIITIICELMSAYISLDCYITGFGASKDTYFIPTVIIIMIVLVACRFMAAVCIDILNEQESALIDARNEAIAAKKIADSSNESKSAFLSNMSHEIRTPLNAVLNYNTMILRESKEKSVKEYAINVRNSCQTLLSLVNDILDLSKIESGKMELVTTEYDFATLLYDVTNMISVRANHKNLEVKLEVDESLPSSLYGDDTRIRQILVNIMNNAVKYTEKGSVSLCVTGERMETEVLLHFHIKDTGIGIKKEDMGKLFAKFERIEEKRNKGIEGTGLGMSITTTFLALMDSELKVDSVYGEGSDFYFDLRQKIVDDAPLGKLEERMHDLSSEETYNVLFTAPEACVLVVDDNEMNLNVFVGLLKETRMHIDKATSGRECIEMCKNKKYDIIFLDHMMPEMSGIETLEEMKQMQDFANANTPVIALTANAIVGAREEYLQVGFSDYLTKPLNPNKLEKMMMQYLPKELQKAGQKKEVQLEQTVQTEEEELPEINGIRWEIARQNYKDNKLLLGIIKDFVTLGKKESATLQYLYQNLLEASDENQADALNDYRIQVHSMKTSAGMIGAMALSEMARWLEYAARDEKKEDIEKLHTFFVKYWDAMVDDVQKVFFETEEDKTDMDADTLREYLTMLSMTTKENNIDGMDAIAKGLKKNRYTQEQQKLVNEMVLSIAEIDYDRVLSLIEELMDTLS